MSLDACIEYCDQLNYNYAGAEFADECYCGNSIVTNQGAGTVASASDCNMPCSGETAQICGGPSRMTVYHRVLPSLNLPSGWSQSFCSYDTPKGSVLTAAHTTIASMTPAGCVSYCNNANYAFGESLRVMGWLDLNLMALGYSWCRGDGLLLRELFGDVST